MANTQTASELVVTKFLSDFFKEYVRSNRFSKETGTGMNNVICIKEGRKIINIPLVTRLKGNGVSGSSTLRGNGENIGNYGYNATPTYYRHAVEFDKEELEKPNIDLMRAARPLLLDWSMELVRDHVIEAMGAVHNGTAYSTYGSATAAIQNSWQVNNTGRVFYGTGVNTGVHGTDLGNIATTETLDTTGIAKMKRIAKNARPRIRPIKTRGDEEWFIAYVDSYAFRDFKADMDSIHQNGSVRGRDNPIFRDNDLVYDGVIVREVPEIADFIDEADGTWGAGAAANDLSVAGTSSQRISPVFLCGAQALGFGLGQRPDIIVDREYDYGFQPGVACECKHDILKSFYDNSEDGSTSAHIQHGMVTAFFSATI